MDAEQFDAITKTFASTSHRRRLLSRVIAGLGVLGAATVTRQSATAARPNNLCCEYICQGSGRNRPLKHTCLRNIRPGQDRCPGSFQNCSFQTAKFVDDCQECPKP
jgi:hypothetical protein